MSRTDPGSWTRRRMLVTLASVSAAPAMPAMAAVPRRGATIPAGLVEVCVAATSDPLPARLGVAAAAGRNLPDLAASLQARLGPGAAEDWRRALLEGGRRDIAAGDMIEVLGRPLMRTEADVLALGVLLRGAGAA